jgi:hypothetical protein
VSGLVVVGSESVAVARAIDPEAWVLDEGDASPAIAAEHRGAPLEPEALVAEAKEADVVGIRGDLLSPLTPRYSVRDLALALGAPVVLTEPALYGVTGIARLAAEAARGAGLAVAAIVLAQWPDPPDRVLLDERVLLHETTGIPVLTLSDGERPDWPVEEWRATDVGAGPGTPQRVVLEPYRAWEGEVPGDPRTAPRPRIMEALTEIITVEGPLLASRAYSVYHLGREGRIELLRADDIPWQGDDVVRALDTPEVVVRELGPRELIEVPLDEVAELMRRLRAAGHAGDLKRAVLDTYGLVRMTARAEQYLSTAEGLL